MRLLKTGCKSSLSHVSVIFFIFDNGSLPQYNWKQNEIIVGFLGRKSVLSIFDAAESIPALKKVEPIAKYISEHYMERITLDVLSECVKYDKFYICKLMKTTLNTTFTEYLSYVRLQKAEKLLFSTDRPISEIVYETGFSTPQNFFKVFKSMYGYTPYKYKLLYNPNEIT